MRLRPEPVRDKQALSMKPLAPDERVFEFEGERPVKGVKH